MITDVPLPAPDGRGERGRAAADRRGGCAPAPPGRSIRRMDEDEHYKPGRQVPVSGIHVCDCGQGHHWSTDVAGHTFPPLPCSGSTWRLQARAHEQ
ncbi:hypothetical protein SAMN05421870_103104 [Streptomyces qinglanensis]|uniref:Uncharacterized protein n=2 Tax=Streptomyces qinglanensis TaxID=943816 RepID=A0A1H9QTD9_9ACTN|nr:hypothetical protein SAMN05421870_103104 [Streptomyces qinglanensis]